MNKKADRCRYKEFVVFTLKKRSVIKSFKINADQNKSFLFVVLVIVAAVIATNSIHVFDVKGKY